MGCPEPRPAAVSAGWSAPLAGSAVSAGWSAPLAGWPAPSSAIIRSSTSASTSDESLLRGARRASASDSAAAAGRLAASMEGARSIAQRGREEGVASRKERVCAKTVAEAEEGGTEFREA